MLRAEFARQREDALDRGDEPLRHARPRHGLPRRRMPTRRCRAEERAFYTAPTDYMPTDGIVRKTALEATKGAKTDFEKAKTLYEWIVDNTFRDPKTIGCGRGDVKMMLETGNLGGKCADLNALYVAMARSIGLPARDVYGAARGEEQVRLPQPRRRHRERDARAALPRGSVRDRPRLDPGRSGGRAQGRPRGEAPARHAHRPGRAARCARSSSAPGR